MALWLLPHAWRVSVLRRLWETLRYPVDVPKNLPQAEILSIAVSPEAHGRGIGAMLMQAAFDEFRRRGILHLKVSVWVGNATAIKFYLRCGFELAATRLHLFDPPAVAPGNNLGAFLHSDKTSPIAESAMRQKLAECSCSPGF
jgi:ribosomal protein S18 acetylase RimI-like enzyme